MKLRALLKQAGVTEGTYSALLQSGAVPFMRSRSARKDGLGREHLMALKTFALLRAQGVSRQTAGVAVQGAFPAICALSADREHNPSASYKVGVRLVLVRERLVATPYCGEPEAGTSELGRVEFDLRAIAALLPPATQAE